MDPSEPTAGNLSPRSESPTSDCESLKSDQSMDFPANFRKEPGPSDTKNPSLRSESPTSDCESLKSDQSMGHPANFRNEPGPSDTKIQSIEKETETESEEGDTAMDSDETSQTSSINGDSGNKDKVEKRQRFVKNSEKSSQEEQRQRNFDELLCRLNLKDNNKLTTADFLVIGPSIKKQDEITEADIAYTFLQKLFMLDYRARDMTVDSTKVQRYLYDICGANVTDQSMKQCNVHPMDVQMAVFHCSDSFLRQNMITKLSQCQYALPLLVPDPVTRDIQCPLWTFRQIKKSWNETDDSGAITIKNMPICQAETPMVSFSRLGSLSSSKSKLMNMLINDRHSTFFHRDCPGATKSHCLIDGMAEIAWYFPAGKSNDAFSDCIAFCNLHGDALSLEKQRQILIDKASINVVLIPTLGKDDMKIVSDLVKGPKPLICLLADKDSVTEISQGTYTMSVKDRSQSDVAKELKRIIREILSSPYTSFQLESMGNGCGIKTDEDNLACQNGRSAAEEILKLLEGKEFSQIKDTFLPCQGQLWHEWCQIHKELYRLRGHVEKDKSQKQEKLRDIRCKQREQSSSELMRMFIENLQSLKLNDKCHFLKWIGFFLDNLCTDNISEINQKYDATRSEVSALKKKKNKHVISDKLKAKTRELKDISNKLQSATVGVEYLFREMGQMFEAHAPCTALEKWSQYPKLAAELMIAGHPMELMDGDAAHVPLTWITHVLDEVIYTLGDKRVFVLSVLGIQSSGKSTMLNAIFGLQFAVSAGRCTRGAFMQLVKVSEEIQKDFKFDYLLVVDTEGLRAPELAGQDTRQHDNALGTFVIGLANLTLINIFGENASEMEDVLQIAVQAFMRMKMVKLSPSCMFVHQNVAAIEACEKNKVGKGLLEEKLDEMTKLAAKEEEFEAEVFSDVIAFDVEKDVKYFAQLWEGSPPMAPPNPGYSESIQELKNMILSKASQSDGMTLSEFNSTIKDLWNALLSENFVFNFKNTKEISLYRKLEGEYSKWTWALRQEMLTIANKLHNRIENGRLDKITESDLMDEIKTTWEDVEKTVTNYFDKSKDADALVQWKTQFETKIKYFRDEQVREAKQNLEEIIQQRNARKKIDAMKKVYENQLLQKSKELASKLKDKAKDENELEKEFNTLWKDWVTELTADVKPIKDINIQEDVDSIIHDHDMAFERSLLKDSRKWYKDMSKRGHFSDYIASTITKALKKKKELPYEDNEQIRALIAKVERQTNVLIKKKPVNTEGYLTGYMHEVANNVEEQVKEFESDKKMTYALKKEFKVDLLLNACTIAKDCFQKAHNEFKKNNDAHTYLDNQKGQYYNVFRSFCKGNSSAAVFSELLCCKLKESAIQDVYDKTAIHLAGQIRSSQSPFSGNRVNLEKHVLQSLAEENKFDSYMNYIRDPRKQVERFIEDYVKTYISTNQNKVLGIMKKNLEDLVQQLNQAVYEATEKVKTKSGDSSMWLDEFSSQLKDVLHVTINCYDNFNDITNFDFLKEEIEKSLKVDLNNLSINEKDFWLKTVQILINQLCKCCWVQCPFCKAICTNTLEDHSPESDHSVPFHRPSGINGWHLHGTVQLCITFCTTHVAGDLSFFPTPNSQELIPYKEYRKGGPKYDNWRITPDESKLTYWKWFVCQFQKELEDHYGKKFEGSGEIPAEWKNHTREEAIQSLENM